MCLLHIIERGMVDMRERTEIKRICLFCGKERTVTKVSEDGMDYMGHGRGMSESWEEDPGCTCELGKKVKQKFHVTRMCLNCAHYKGGCCTNKKMLSAVTTMFDIGDTVKVADPKKCCGEHRLGMDIFKDVIEMEKKG